MAQWPNLVEITPDSESPDPRVSRAHWAALRRVAAGVRGRTDARAYYDLWRGQVCFGYQRPRNGRIDLIGGCDFDAFKGGWQTSCPFQFDPATDGVGVEDVVHLVRLARVDPKVKDRWRRELQDRGKRDEAEERGRDWENDERREVESLLDHRVRGRRGLVVNGMKGAA